MRKHEIQKVYLDIQASLGVLIQEAKGGADKQKLRRISIELITIKRNMIGTFDEIDANITL